MPGINALALKKAQATRGLKWWFCMRLMV